MSEVNQREWQYIQDLSKISRLLKEKVQKATFFLKETEPPAEVYRGPDRENNEFEFHLSPDLQIENVFTLYATLNRQLEIDFEKTDSPDEGTVYAIPKEARISKVQRSETRHEVLDNSVNAAHFQVSKSELLFDNTKPQVANKVIYAEFERILGKEVPGLKIFDYANKDRPEETVYLNRETQSIYVEDLQNEENYKSIHPGTIDYHEILEEEGKLESKLKFYRDNQLQSLIVKPILNQMADGKRRPIAFFHAATNRGEAIGPSVLDTLEKAGDEIINRIMDATLLNIDERQPVLNITSKGVCLMLTNPDLVKYVPNSRVLTFDLIFKMQAPLRFRGIVKHLRKIDQNMLAGISLEGTGHHESVGKKNALDKLGSLIKHIKTT